uniref:Ras-related protein Rab-32 n=3 Tax=Lepeophtheirus salmonis TaxID=72036 RepID=D3PIB3_LEPSM|nr:Ras-related protein Rab-32 [Lepeophtheirus salmonis]
MFLFRRFNYDAGIDNRLYKIIVIGEVNSGKSAFIRRFIDDSFCENYYATVGVDFHLKVLQFKKDLEVRLQLWDIAGQERFSKMTRAYFKGSVGAIVLYDSGNVNTFNSVKKWKEELDEKCALPEGQNVPAILLSNKSDMPKHPNLPSDEEISKFVETNGFVPKWFKTSAKTGENIQECINFLIKVILKVDSWSTPYYTSPFGGCHSNYRDITPEVEDNREIKEEDQIDGPSQRTTSSHETKKVVFYNCSDCEEEDRPKDAEEVKMRKIALRNYMRRTEIRRRELLNIINDDGTHYQLRNRENHFFCKC